MYQLQVSGSNFICIHRFGFIGILQLENHFDHRNYVPSVKAVLQPSCPKISETVVHTWKGSFSNKRRFYPILILYTLHVRVKPR